MKMPNRDIANQLNYAYFTPSNNPQIVKTNFNKLLSIKKKQLLLLLFNLVIQGELNPKIKFVLLERTLKITVGYLSIVDSLSSFLRYFSFFDMQIKKYDVVHTNTDTNIYLMSVAQGVVAQSPEPEARVNALQ